MVTFQGRARKGRHGKLTGVLDHQLRIGDEKVSDAVVAAYKERGLEPPGHLETPPQILPQFLAYWEAYRDLISERRAPRGPIPALAIIEYADAYGINRDSLKRIVWAVDAVLMEHWKDLDAAAEAKRKADAKRPAALGGKA